MLSETTCKTVLIVEDSDELQMLLMAALRRENFKIIMASTGHASLEYLQSHPAPQLQLLDLTLPDMEIMDYFEQQRAAIGDARVPLILTSGRHDLREYARRMNADAYLMKPYGIAELLQSVSKHCAA
jgi:DNA-binding response OmpR family regulator